MWPTTSRQSRGYGAAWERKRKRILERDGYLCQCKYCKAEDKVTPANEVDHAIPKAKARKLGWTDDQIDADDNLRAINHDCHKRKTLEDEGTKPKQRIGLDGWPV